MLKNIILENNNDYDILYEIIDNLRNNFIDCLIYIMKISNKYNIIKYDKYDSNFLNTIEKELMNIKKGDNKLFINIDINMAEIDIAIELINKAKEIIRLIKEKNILCIGNLDHYSIGENGLNKIVITDIETSEEFKLIKTLNIHHFNNCLGVILPYFKEIDSIIATKMAFDVYKDDITYTIINKQSLHTYKIYELYYYNYYKLLDKLHDIKSDLMDIRLYKDKETKNNYKVLDIVVDENFDKYIILKKIDNINNINITDTKYEYQCIKLNSFKSRFTSDNEPDIIVDTYNSIVYK